jgi:hypothetical protein
MRAREGARAPREDKRCFFVENKGFIDSLFPRSGEARRGTVLPNMYFYSYVPTFMYGFFSVNEAAIRGLRSPPGILQGMCLTYLYYA